jgi:hypothetical protein
MVAALVVGAAPPAAARATVHIGSPLTKVASAGFHSVSVLMDVTVKSDRPVKHVRIFLQNTRNDDVVALYAVLWTGTYRYGQWQAWHYFLGERHSAWRVRDVRVYGPGYRVLRDKTVDPDTAAVVAVHSDAARTLVSSHRAAGPPSSRVVQVSFDSALDDGEDVELGGLSVRFTGTFDRPGGSTFVRSRGATTTEDGAQHVAFGPYRVARLSSLTLSGPAAHGSAVTWAF